MIKMCVRLSYLREPGLDVCLSAVFVCERVEVRAATHSLPCKYSLSQSRYLVVG